MGQIIKFIDILRSIIIFAIFAQVLLSWVKQGRQKTQAEYILDSITEPFIRVAKMIPHRIGMIDLSPIIAVFGVDIFANILIAILQRGF